MASGKKPEPPGRGPVQIDLFSRPAPPPREPEPEPKREPAPPFERPQSIAEPPWEEFPFYDDEPPPLELLDLTGDGMVPVPPAARINAAVQQNREESQRQKKPGSGSGSGSEAEEEKTWRVSDLVRVASRTLEARYPDLWVEGEISNLRVPGHVYFTLKDAEAQLPAVMFRSDAAKLKFRLSDGLKVRVRGRLSIFEQQGKFQLYARAIEPAGVGALQLAFEQLKKRLQAEGLFDEGRKRKLPFLPRRIGVATSPTGAAVRDIVRVATRRGPVRLIIAPCLVQGDGAPADIVRALAALERQPDVDLIIVGRGGGSMEDLWAFNDELVARAIAACRVPVISAVGHEVDFTIADFVADRRAATPSQAAELAVPMHGDLVRRVEDLSSRLSRAGRRTVADARLRLDAQVGRATALLQRSIGERRRTLRAASERLAALHPRARVARDRAALVELSRRLGRPLPDRLARSARALATLRQRLDAAMQQSLARRHRSFEGAAGKLEALSPLKVLERGYGLVRGPGGEVITRAAQVAPGAAITVRLSEGTLGARVEKVTESEIDSPNGNKGGDGSG